jgi:Kef-type K+ transport system membrane component KefB
MMMLIGGGSFLIAFASDAQTQLLLTLFVMFGAAKLAAEIFERLRQPAVAGEILAGVVIGPSVLGLVAPGEVISALSEIGVVLLLFLVGLETKPGDIFRVGLRALVVAMLGVAIPFLAGYGIIWWWGAPQIEAIFVGAALVATSVGITARVLGQMGLMHLETSRIILAAAVIDDVLGLIILAVVASLAQGGVNYVQIGTTAALAIIFTLLVALIGARAVNRIKPRVDRLRVGEAPLIFGLTLCLGLAFFASYIGVAAIIGAFLAGMALSESVEGTEMPRQAEAVTEFFLPFFFANIGMQLNLGAFLSRDTLILAVIITLVAIVTKIIGCGIGAASLGLRRALQVGIGMSPRGEVGIVVAQIGLGLAAISDAVYGVVLFMAVATTLIAPPLLVLAYRGEAREEVPEDYPVTPLS